MKNMIKIGVFLLLAILLLYYPFTQGDSKTTITDMNEAITPLIDNEATYALDDKDMRKYFGIEKEEVKGSLAYRATDTMSAQTLVILQLNKQEDAEILKDKLKKYIENEHTKYDGYILDQVRILDNYTMIEKKGYIFLSIGDNTEWESAFKKIL